MWKNWRQDFGYRIFALLAAITLWLYVTGEQNPTGQNIVSVPLETENLAEGLVVAERPSEVQVRVEGRKNVIARLTPRDVHALVDLRNVKVGENRLPVVTTLPEGVSLVNVSPVEVAVRIDRASEAQLPLKVNLIGLPAGGFKTMEPVIKPSQVLVSGPDEVLRSIGRVYIEADIDQARGNYLAQLPVKVADRDGRPMQRWVAVRPDTVEVFIPVVRDQPAKRVPIRPKLVGAPAKGYVVQRVVLEPEVVEIFGPYELLATIDYLHTMPIEIKDAKKNIVLETDLELSAVQKEHTSGQNQLGYLQKQIEELKNLTGLTAIAGPGIVVTMDDNNAGAQVAKSSSPANFRPDDFIIHDKNVLYMVNELKAAGAEAISVNGQRITTSSHIRCVGTVILVNSTRIAPPYEIQAIGDPDRLAEAVERAEEFVYLKTRDFPVRVAKAQNLTFPAYSGSFPAEHLRPAMTGGESSA